MASIKVQPRLNEPAQNGGAPVEELCLGCGMCCNGVIFADVQLRSGEDRKHFETLGLEFVSGRESPAAASPAQAPRALRGAKNQPKFAQPCRALDGCRCRIYPERPRYCREFECLLFKNVKDGRLATAAALRIIQDARERADKVRNLLQLLGDKDEHIALAARFRRTTRRVEQNVFDQSTADAYGELTLAVHDLNVLLSQAFYPG